MIINLIGYSIIILYCLILLFILIYCLFQLHLYWKHHFGKKKLPQNLKQLSGSFPVVTIQLPIFNEMHVARRIIKHCCQLDYPLDKLHIQVLDDSTDKTLDISIETITHYQKQGYDIELVHRKDRKGYKAGALREALSSAKGEFIAIFDADFIPPKGFLQTSLPHFTQEKVGVVQGRWMHINEDYSLITRLQAFQLNVHFMIEQSGRFRGEYYLQFNGTAGIWRKETIINAGNWQADTLTEDLDLSYRAQLKGWRITYLNHLGSPAELPVEMNGLKSQQYRWMKGGAETATKILPQLWKSSISLGRKVQGTAHLLSSSVFLLIFLGAVCSIPMLLFMSYRGIPAHFLGIFLAATLSIIAVYYSANVLQMGQNPRTRSQKALQFIGLFPMFLSLSMGLSLHNSIAVWDGFRGKRTSFIRTPKYNIRKKEDRFSGHPYLSQTVPTSTKVEIALAFLFLSASAYGWYIDYMAFFLFHVLLTIGFGGIAYFSLKHVKHS